MRPTKPTEALLKRVRGRTEATEEEVMAGLLREARGGLPNTSSAARVTAWRLIGERLGMWELEKEERHKSGLEKLVEHFEALRRLRERDRGQQ